MVQICAKMSVSGWKIFAPLGMQKNMWTGQWKQIRPGAQESWAIWSFSKEEEFCNNMFKTFDGAS